VLNILSVTNSVTYFSTSITMNDLYKVAICVTYDERCQRSLWHQLDIASCEFHS